MTFQFRSVSSNHLIWKSRFRPASCCRSTSSEPSWYRLSGWVFEHPTAFLRNWLVANGCSVGNSRHQRSNALKTAKIKFKRKWTHQVTGHSRRSCEKSSFVWKLPQSTNPMQGKMSPSDYDIQSPHSSFSVPISNVSASWLWWRDWNNLWWTRVSPVE